MIDPIIESLEVYYGVDWISFVLGFLGLWLLSIKNKNGFLFQVIAVICSAITAYIAGQYAYIFSSVGSCVIMGYGYYNWNKDTNDKENTP